jgi:hypothetical protein
MKASIKRLRTCSFSTAVAPTGFMGQPVQHTNKLICDHPQMKEHWMIETCEKCQVYVNRNKPPEPVPAEPKKKRGRKPKAAKE